MPEREDASLLARRAEDAGLNASAPPQQRWLDGWLVRTNPGKAKRARCVNALAAGHLPLDRRLALAAEVYAEAALPMVFRITPYSLPASLDDALAERGFERHDDTRVMLCPRLPPASGPMPLPSGLQWFDPAAADFADTIGALRHSPPEQRSAHAERLAQSPVPFSPLAIQRSDDGAVVACGQFTRESDLVGLYDIHTREDARGQGLARRLCQHLLQRAAALGATAAYLQVDAANAPARHIYTQLGFTDAYAYHYRHAPSRD